MSRSRLFVLDWLRWLFGGFLAMQVYRNLQSRTNTAVPIGSDVLIAARDVQIGTRVTDGDIK